MTNNQKIIIILGIICLMAIFQLTGSAIPDYLVTIITGLIASIVGISINTTKIGD